MNYIGSLCVLTKYVRVSELASERASERGECTFYHVQPSGGDTECRRHGRRRCCRAYIAQMLAARPECVHYIRFRCMQCAIKIRSYICNISFCYVVGLLI